jgi:Xaa-Pro aminopeptidase
LGSLLAMQTLMMPTLAETLRLRRQRLATQMADPVVLWSGQSRARNYLANTYPFRAGSHFLYFAGVPLANAAVRLEAGRLELFMDTASAAARLWHGDAAGPDQVAAQIGADAVYPLSQLPGRAVGAATIPGLDAVTLQAQTTVLKRPMGAADMLEGADQALAEAIVRLRLAHDERAIAEIRQAAAVTSAAHRAGMQATRRARLEAEVRAAMEAVVIAHNLPCAYNSIVTVHGEVLHNDHYHHPLQPGDLLLADMAAESASGWASDVTRTWPVSGRFSESQRAIYDVVLAAHDACIAEARPGVEYRDLHLLAATVLSEGLIELGILRGQSQDLVAQDAHTLFFPHGVGHLLGRPGRSGRLCGRANPQPPVWLGLPASRPSATSRNGRHDRARILSGASPTQRSRATQPIPGAS